MDAAEELTSESEELLEPDESVSVRARRGLLTLSLFFLSLSFLLLSACLEDLPRSFPLPMPRASLDFVSCSVSVLRFLCARFSAVMVLATILLTRIVRFLAVRLGSAVEVLDF